jgi:hypothetical protein
MSENIKKIRIAKDKLPFLGGINGFYNVRFKIMSEDKNRSSAWSPIYTLNTANISSSSSLLTKSVQIVKKKSATIGIYTVDISWSVPQNLQLNSFDIYIKTYLSGNASTYQYVGTVNSSSYHAVFDKANQTVDKVDILVQVPTIIKEVIASAKLFDKLNIVLDDSSTINMDA